MIYRDTVDNTVTWSDMLGPARRPRSAGAPSRRRSEPVAYRPLSLDRRTSCDSRLHHALAESRTSLQSIASINTDNSEEFLVKCKYSKCSSKATPVEAKRHYKTCHNCNYVYCSKECRRAHWEKHRKVCLHSRASSLCRQILSAAKEDTDSLHQVSTVAHKGYLSVGRGVVKILFTSPEAAEKFTAFGFQYLSQPEYVRWTDLQPNEMGAELYTEVVKLCKSYNPESKLILFVAVCVISEVPTKGAVKWERQLVSRCAKLRLSRSVSAAIQRSNAQQAARVAKRRSRENSLEAETLVLKWREERTRRQRESCLSNVQRHLERRGVELKKHYPEVYSRLLGYAEGTVERFHPVTIHPRDETTGRTFVCVITPDSEHPVDSGARVTIVDVGAGDLLSTPM